MGKGAGGYPTGSAVLSDISALTYKYKYEYKKTKQDSGLQLSTDIVIKIYLRFDHTVSIDRSLFEQILEEYKALENQYIIGEINFTRLIESNLLTNSNVSVILLEHEEED
jgi:homoserine dehydrogenase